MVCGGCVGNGWKMNKDKPAETAFSSSTSLSRWVIFLLIFLPSRFLNFSSVPLLTVDQSRTFMIASADSAKMLLLLLYAPSTFLICILSPDPLILISQTSVIPIIFNIGLCLMLISRISSICGNNSTMAVWNTTHIKVYAGVMLCWDTSYQFNSRPFYRAYYWYNL